MEEIEVKILDVNVKKTVKKLLDIGATKVFEGDIRASYFNFKKRPLPYNLRLRMKGDLAELCYKTPLGVKGAKAMAEHETHVQHDDTKNMLLAMGMRETGHSSKHRVSYRKGDVLYEFDTYPGIPTLLEVEAKTLGQLEKAVKAIGFTMKDTKPWSSKEVFRHYRK